MNSRGATDGAPVVCKNCHGSGLAEITDHPGIHDVPAGKYTDEHLCPRCKGSGVEA